MHARCLAAMPARYPKPYLIVHETSEQMVGFLGREGYAFQHRYADALVAGVADAHRNAVHLPFDQIREGSAADVLAILLHELGHLHAAQRYGKASPEYTDERRANAFARRWQRRLAGSVV